MVTLAGEKLAVADDAAATVREHVVDVPAAAHTSPQPPKTFPGPGVAVSMTAVPKESDSVQIPALHDVGVHVPALQLKPLTLVVTTPAPAPASVTDMVKMAGVNVADTKVALFTFTVHVAATVPAHASPHDANT